MLPICHCYKENDTIRLISARKVNRKEARQYGERLWEMIMILPTQSRIHTQTDWRNRLRFVLMIQSSPTSKKWLIRQECHIRTLSTTIFWIASRITKRWRFPCWLGFDFKRAVRHVGEASFAKVSLLYEVNIILSIKMPLSMVQPNPYGTCVYCSYDIDSTSDTDSVYS